MGRPQRAQRRSARCAMRKAEQQRKRGGQALVEFALMLPLMLILIANIVNFAGLYYAFVEVGNASRSAGDYTIMGSVAYSGTDPSGAAGPPLTAASDMTGTAGAQLVANMLGTDMSALPNRKSIQVRLCALPPAGITTCHVCSNSAGTGIMSCTGGSGSFTAPLNTDTSTGEGLNYTMTWVDVSYTYNPFIPLGFKFPGLGLRLTLPSNLVFHRQSVYRVLD